MKKFALFLCCLFLLNLCACKADVPATEVPVSEPAEFFETEPTETEEFSVPVETEPEEIISKEDPPKLLIETPYYTLELPKDWEGKCVWKILDKEDGTYILNLFEVTAHEAMGGGKLCSIMLLPTTEDWSVFPNYTLHGILYTPDGDYQVVALYPTDVQFNGDTMDAYNALAAQLADVLTTIAPAPGIEHVAPAPII